MGRTWTAAELAKAAGLGRPYVYYLAKVGLLRSAGPRGGRVVFDENALRLARAFAQLQRRHGIRPHGLVTLVEEAIDAHHREEMKRLRPLREKMATIEAGAWAEAGVALDRIVAGPVRDSMASAEDVVASTREHRADVERSMGHNLLNMAAEYLAAKRKHDDAVAKIGEIPSDSPAWESLDPLFPTRKARTEFVDLLRRTGVLQRLATARLHRIKEADEE